MRLAQNSCLGLLFCFLIFNNELKWLGTLCLLREASFTLEQRNEYSLHRQKHNIHALQSLLRTVPRLATTSDSKRSRTATTPCEHVGTTTRRLHWEKNDKVDEKGIQRCRAIASVWGFSRLNSIFLKTWWRLTALQMELSVPGKKDSTWPALRCFPSACTTCSESYLHFFPHGSIM